MQNTHNIEEIKAEIKDDNAKIKSMAWSLLVFGIILAVARNYLLYIDYPILLSIATYILVGAAAINLYRIHLVSKKERKVTVLENQVIA